MQEAGTPIEGSFEPLKQSATPAQPGAGGSPAAAPTGSVPAVTGEVQGEAGAPVEGSFQPVGAAEPPKPPTDTISSAQNPSLMEAVRSKDAGGMLKLWSQNVANDIKYGTDVTGVGTLLKKMGAHGVYMGNPAAVGDFMASLPLGLLKAGGGIADANNHPWQSTKDIVSGGLQAAEMPGAFVGPEASADTLEAAGDVATAGARKVGQGAKRVVSAYTEPRTVPDLDIDREAIKASAMRGVQPRMQSGLRSIMKSLESEAGIEKPAGSPPEAPIEQQSIRDAVKKTSDAFIARARSIYASLDEATGGQFQRFEDQLKEVNQQLKQLVSTPDEASMDAEAALDSKRAAIEEARDAAFDRAKKQGVDPTLIENARSDFKRGQALKDLDYNVKKVASGARPGQKMLPEDLARDPELLHPERLQRRLDSMYDSGRLQEAVGQENATRMINDASKHKVAVQQATRSALDNAERTGRIAKESATRRIAQNSAIRKGVLVGAGALAAKTPLGESALKTATHVFLPGIGVVAH